jgi:ketosteroid isomerase-like protein
VGGVALSLVVEILRGMSEENVELVRDFLDAALRQDWERAAELLDPNVEGHGTVGGLEEGQVCRGLLEMIHAFETVDLEAWEERRLDPEEFLHVDDLVVLLLHEYRRGSGSGVELENDTATLFTVRDGRIVRIQGYMDQDAALKAAGLLD